MLDVSLPPETFDPRLTVRTNLRTFVAGVAVALLLSAVLNVVSPLSAQAPQLALADALAGIVTGVLALLMRRRPVPLALAQPLSLLALASTGVAVALVLAYTGQPLAGSYLGLLAAATGWLVLGWAWFGAGVLIVGIALAPGLAAHADVLDLLVAASGLGVGIMMQSSRLQGNVAMQQALARVAAAQRASTEAAAGMRAIFDASPAGMVVADARTGLVTDVNPAVERLVGIGREEAIGRPTALFIAPEEGARHAEGMRALGAGEVEATARVLNVRHKDGTARLVKATAVLTRDASGEPARIIATMEDVTEARRREAELSLQSRMLSSIGQAVIVTDPAGKITYWNGAAERLYGWAASEVIGRSVVDVTPSEMSREQAVEIFERLRAGMSWSGEFQVRRRDGTTFLAAITDAPVLDDAGELVGVIGISEDVSGKRATEAALRRAERDAALGTLVAGVAHEINNPLQFMGGNLDLAELDVADLATRAPDDARTRELVEQIHGELGLMRRGLEQIERITRSLRQVARRSEGPRAPIDANAVVQDVLATVAPRMGPDVEVRVDLRATRRPLANASELAQVLLNLVLNATEAMDGRGVLQVRSRDEDDGLTLEVQDDGPGIPSDVQARLFTPFLTTKPNGTGLGLPISQGIVRDHGGTIHFESAPGRTVFRVRLPACAPRASVAQA